MPLFIDIHRCLDGWTAEAAARAHGEDLDLQVGLGVRYLRYWFSEEDASMFCLVEAPSAELAEQVHRESHGLIADEITRVREGM